MEELIKSLEGTVQSLEQLTASTMESAMQSISQIVDETTSMQEKKKEEFKQQLAAFHNEVVNRFSEIDKQELFNAITEVKDKVAKDSEESYKEAMKTMEKFVKEHEQKK